MIRNARAMLLASTAAGFLLMASPSHAAEASADAIKALQKQVQMLQEQLNQMQAQQQEQKTAAAASPSPAAAPSPSSESGKEILPGVKFKAGGFVDLTGVYRSKNQTVDNGTNFNTGIPFNNSVNAHQSEFRATARSTKLTVKATADVDNDTKLGAYVESDFLGSGTTSNSVQTNSYTPRLRQAFATIDRNDWGLHILAGQAWTLLTTNKTGITPLAENAPGVLDASYMPGFNYARQPQIRVVKEFADKQINVGVSLESPQANLSGLCSVWSGSTCSTAIPAIVNANNTGASALNTSTTYSTEYAPDIQAKIAFDPGWGHYEIFGVGRFFHDNVLATYHNNTVFAGGGGAAAILPIIPKKLDFQANVMAGEGIGKYSTSALPDFAISHDGAIKPLTEYTALVGLVGHPDPSWDMFLYAGGELVDRQDDANVLYGYGNRQLNLSGCNTQGGTCQAQTHSVWSITPGFWKRIYDGAYGKMQLGAQYSFTRRDAFSSNNNGGPHAYENVVLTSIRYSPFQ